MDENTKKRLDQQFAFIREIDREKFIGRQTYLSDGKRKENDAEHAWHMAIMTMVFFRKNRERCCMIFGLNLRRRRRQKQSLRV